MFLRDNKITCVVNSLKSLKMYKFWYILGLVFMGLFFLSSIETLHVMYILLSLVCFIISGKYYEKEKGA